MTNTAFLSILISDIEKYCLNFCEQQMHAVSLKEDFYMKK
jgi:hypothetical protein